MICIDRIIWASYIGGWKCRTHLRCCSPHCACWCWAMGMERPSSLASTMGMRSLADDVFLLRGIIDIRMYRYHWYHMDIVAHVLKTFWSSSVVIRSWDHPSLSSCSRWQCLDSVDFVWLSRKWKHTHLFFIAKSQLSWFHVACVIHLDIVWAWFLDRILCGWGHCFLHLFAESLYCSAWSGGPNSTWKFHFGVPWILWIHPGSLRQGSRDSSHLVLAGLLCSFSHTNSHKQSLFSFSRCPCRIIRCQSMSE